MAGVEIFVQPELKKPQGARYCILPTLVLLTCHAPTFAGDDIAWRHGAEHGAVTLTANPLEIGQRVAFYEARGFPARTVGPYAQACGFSFRMENGGDKAIVARLADWRVVGADGRAVAFVPPEAWDSRWRTAGVPEAARIAFRWAQFQSENLFEPGDWIMGMATLESRPAAPFRLVARYRDDRGDHEIILERLDCAVD